jgi:hypothetical protein
MRRLDSLHLLLVLVWLVAEARACDARRTERAAVMRCR